MLARVEERVSAGSGEASASECIVHFYECLESAPRWVEGIDVAHAQGRIDWRRAAGDGKVFAFVRVTDGASLVDGSFEQNWRSSKQAGAARRVSLISPA